MSFLSCLKDQTRYATHLAAPMPFVSLRVCEPFAFAFLKLVWLICPNCSQTSLAKTLGLSSPLLSFWFQSFRHISFLVRRVNQTSWLLLVNLCLQFLSLLPLLSKDSHSQALNPYVLFNRPCVGSPDPSSTVSP